MMAIVFDENFKGSGMTLGADKLSVIQKAGNYNFVRVTEGKISGKWYWEYKWVKGARVSVGIVSSDLGIEYTGTSGYFANIPGVGVPTGIGSGVGFGNWGHTGDASLHWTSDIVYRNPEGYAYGCCNYGSIFDEFDTVGVALDLDLQQIAFYINGVSQGVAIGNLPAKTYYAAVAIDSVYGGVSIAALNLGVSAFQYPIPDGYRPYDPQETPDGPPTGETITLLRVTMIDSSEREFQVEDDELNRFIQWYNYHADADPAAFRLKKRIGAQAGDAYLPYHKIISYETMKCLAK